MDIHDWSVTAASNTDVDGTDIDEGCDPANINNAIRAVMANIAALRDLIGGAKVSAGTANAQTLTTGLSLSAYSQGLPISFEAGSGLTNTGACTVDVDGIGAKSVKLVDGSNPPAGAITAGGIYMLAYEAGADVLILMNPTPGSDLVDDTTPQLGGDLDLNGHALDFPSTPDIADVLDEDDMNSDSATALATQQSIKAYADTMLPLAGGTMTGAIAMGGNNLTNVGNLDVTEYLRHEGDLDTYFWFRNNQISMVVAGANMFDIVGGTYIDWVDKEHRRPKLKDYSETLVAHGNTGGGTEDFDLSAGNVHSATVNSSANTFTFSNPPASGTAGSLTLILTNGGSQTVNWPASVDWAGGSAPTLTSSGVDILTFLTTNGGTTWYGFAAGLDMS